MPITRWCWWPEVPTIPPQRWAGSRLTPWPPFEGLGRKLPHYTRYSYLGFRGDEPENVAKGMWQPLSSPLVRHLGEGDPPPLVLPDRLPLAELPAVFDAAEMSRAVTFLADPRSRGPGPRFPGPGGGDPLGGGAILEASACFRWAMAGFASRGSGLEGTPSAKSTLLNLVGGLPGTDENLADQPVLVLAHLDHLGRGWPDVRAGNEGRVHPGADDNASGVAVLLELARSMADEPARLAAGRVRGRYR